MTPSYMAQASREREPDVIDTLLIFTFLVGMYLELAVQLSATIPFPNVISGFAGFAMLVRHMDRIEEKHVVALAVVLLLLFAAIFCVPDYSYLKKRFTGIVQLSYSIIIGYGLFVTAVRYERNRLARLFLIFCLFIIIGTALENYVTPFRNFSDFARQHLYSFGLYIADTRDEILYGRIRPKLFTSEPSAVTFAFSFFTIIWYLLSTWRYKLPAYLLMMALGYFLMRGPTLLIGLVLVGPCELMRTANTDPAKQVTKIAAVISVSILLLGIAAWAATSLYSTRLDDVLSGTDPSFFYRVIGPALVAFDTFNTHPLAGIGLTSEDAAIGSRLITIFSRSSAFSPDWSFDSNAHVLNNYFWLHWIYFGFGWGVIMFAAFTWYIRSLGARSIALCWLIWAVFGQASGAYVSPKPWAVLMFACVVAILRYRQPAPGALAAMYSPSASPPRSQKRPATGAYA